MMTPRTLRWLAFGSALAVQTAMVVTYGMITDWCFCAITSSQTPAIPPMFVVRFLKLALLPTAWTLKGLGLPILVILNLEAWFVGLLALLHALVFTARVRVRPVLGGKPRKRRIWLAPRDGVRPIHVILIACPLIVALAISGALQRRAWLMKADQVFAAAIKAESAGRALPVGVDFWMFEWRDGDMTRVKPEARFTIKIDPRVAGDRFLDRFLVPYSYGGRVRFESGARYTFEVYRDAEGWAVHVNDLAPQRRW